MAPIYLDPLNNGRDTPPTGNAVPGSLFTGVFRCQGHDRWLAIELEDAVRLVDVVHTCSTVPIWPSTTTRKPMIGAPSSPTR